MGWVGQDSTGNKIAGDGLGICQPGKGTSEEKRPMSLEVAYPMKLIPFWRAYVEYKANQTRKF